MSLFHNQKRGAGLTTDRIEAFSDGVFSIAITLLILGVTVPELSKAQLANGELLPHLVALWPKLLSYLISFVLIGLFWYGHHIMFHFIKRSDRNLVLLNLLLLMLIAFFPFPAALLGEYGTDTAASVIYGSTLVAMGLAFSGIWKYASYKNRLVEPNLPPRIIHVASWVVLAVPLLYLVAVGLAFINPRLSLWVYLIVPVMYLVPSPIDELVDYHSAERET